jgi:hypothetical protein
MTTNKLMNLALSEPDQYYEINKGEDTIGVGITFVGTVVWFINNRMTTEEGVAEVMARWAVEGV